MHILQITDPHLHGRADVRLRGVHTDATLRTVLDAALARYPDYEALLVTGDLVQDDASGYPRFRHALRGLAKPVLCIPGNHDDPAAMAHEFATAPFQLCGARSIGAWRIVMLDSCSAGEVGGQLDELELARLDQELGRCAGHALVCLHHHPVAMGSRWLDCIGLRNTAEFWRVVDAHANVRGVAWGHVHQAFDGRRGAVRLFATPSTGAQFLPGSDHFTIDQRPPAYRHYELHADGRILSRVHWVEAQPAIAAATG
ncbi:MAG TPA: metallophosphoesterase [Steroidobacteraceae bacterium]|nr:metallophosphoesterase [Steroidobacteraceae bacterium]